MKAPVAPAGHPRMRSAPAGGSRRSVSAVGVPARSDWPGNSHMGFVSTIAVPLGGARATTCPPTRFPPMEFPRMNLLPPWLPKRAFSAPVLPGKGVSAGDLPAPGSPARPIVMAASPPRPRSPESGWHKRISTWVDEQARNWGAGRAEQECDGRFYGTTDFGMMRRTGEGLPRRSFSEAVERRGWLST